MKRARHFLAVMFAVVVIEASATPELGDPWRCPKCERLGLPAVKVEVDLVVTETDRRWRPFYDEAGNYHAHNPNRTTTWFKCTREGWLWQLNEIAPCWCGWPRPQEDR